MGDLRLGGRGFVVAAPLLAAALITKVEGSAPSTLSTIPLCPGLAVVTAVSQPDGDYESIKTIQAVGPNEVLLKYSSQRMAQDMFSNKPPHLETVNLNRRILLVDLKSASLYEQQYYEKMPDEAPGTTAIGTSSDLLTALRTKGEADLGIFIAMSGDVSVDRNKHPNIYDFQMIGHIKRVEPGDVMMPVVVNDSPVVLPALHAAGDFFGDKTEFYFLDDPANPLTLKYRFGIGSPASSDINSVIAAMNNKAPQRADKDDFEVTKISYRCAPVPIQQKSAPGAGGKPPSLPSGSTPSPSVEQQLATTGKAEVYDIYFSFNSADIRPESEPSLKEIADVLNKHKDWKLNVGGHTDSIGGHAFNLGLSQRRAQSVKAALVARYHIDGARLSTAGYGDSQPQDTNATLEGRARNRRVELSKL